MAVLRTKGVSQTLGLGCLTLFALPFAGFGAFALYKGVTELARGNWASGLGLFAFGAIFSTVGIGLVAAAIIGTKKAKANEATRSANPDKPWLWREDWARGEVKSGNRQLLAFVTVFTLFWNAVALTAFFAFLPEMRRKPGTLFVLIFVFIGLALFVWMFREMARRRRFGESVLKLTTVPGVVGGALAGVVHTTRPLHGAREVRLRLICIERDTSGDSTSERVQWEDEKLLGGEVLLGGGIPVLFNIPFECRPAATLSGTSSIVWILEASANMPGTDYAARFEVPVFKTAESRPDAPKWRDPTAAYEKPIDLAPPAGVRIHTAMSGGTEFNFGAARNKGAALGLTLFTAIWMGAIVLMIKLQAPIGFPIVFGLFGVLMLLGVIGMWTGASKVVADVSGLNVTHWYCFFSWSKFVSATEVNGIAPKLGMSSGSVTYYDLVATTTAGKNVKLASSIKGKKESEWLVREIQNALARR